MRPEGAVWIGIGFAITFVPVVLMPLFALRAIRLDFGSICGKYGESDGIELCQ